MMDISFSSEFGYMTAPTSASCCSQEMCFYSAPTSPRRLKVSVLSGFHTGPTTPTTHEDANSNLDEFEFETSRRFNLSDFNTETSQKDENPFYHQQEHQQRPWGDSLPTMAFADELFCDGKVLPLTPPLKLPPRLLQHGDGNMMSSQSPTLTSPRSTGKVLRLKFSRHSLWNDDFDPFMVALEKVKEEKRGKPKAKHGLRRSRSLSPFRGFNYQKESDCCGPAQLVCELQKEPLKHASGRTNMLSEPKGLVFARQVRPVGVGNDATFEPKRTSASKRAPASKLAMETKKDESESDGFWTRKKREKIMKFLFGNAYMGKASAQQHKLEDQKAALEKLAFQRKLDMKSVRPTQSTQWDKNETTGEMAKMRLIYQRPRIFLCLGYEAENVK